MGLLENLPVENRRGAEGRPVFQYPEPIEVRPSDRHHIAWCLTPWVPLIWEDQQASGLCQRSFNWQSTALVMRGLWVRVPPLAFGPPEHPPKGSPRTGGSSSGTNEAHQEGFGLLCWVGDGERRRGESEAGGQMLILASSVRHRRRGCFPSVGILRHSRPGSEVARASVGILLGKMAEK